MNSNTPPNSLWTLIEAMAYCGIKSRSTFYKRLADWEAEGLPRPYVNLNTGGKYSVRRFDQELLRQCLKGR